MHLKSKAANLRLRFSRNYLNMNCVKSMHMGKKGKAIRGHKPSEAGGGFGKSFYGAVAVGERGQIVIPKEARDELGIGQGDRLVVFGSSTRGLVLMKLEAVGMRGDGARMGRTHNCSGKAA